MEINIRSAETAIKAASNIIKPAEEKVLQTVERVISSSIKTSALDIMATDARTSYGQLLAKGSIKKVPTQAEIDILDRNITLESCFKALNLNERISAETYRTINPITPTNFAEIKGRALSTVNGFGLKSQIKECKTPEELFKLLKTNIERITSDIDTSAYSLQEEKDKLIKYLKNTKLSTKISECKDFESLQQVFGENIEEIIKTVPSDYFKMTEAEQNLRNAQISKACELFKLLSQKSTKPEILQMEQRAHALGVKYINFADDVEQAKITMEALEEYPKRGVPIPHSIVVSTIIPEHLGGCCLNTGSNYLIAMKTTTESNALKLMSEQFDALVQETSSFKKASPELQRAYLDTLNANEKSLYSTQNPHHKFWHETGHTFQSKDIEDLTEIEKEIASKISGYSSKEGGTEVVPEMFAKLMDRQKLTDEQMALYIKLGGIVPKS